MDIRATFIGYGTTGVWHESPTGSFIFLVQFWVQVYDIHSGFMSEKVAKDIGKFMVVSWKLIPTISLVVGKNICVFVCRLTSENLSKEK